MRVAAFGRIVPFVVLSVLLLAACSSSNKPSVTVGLGETFTIGVGKTAQITGEDLLVTFDEVIGDSRCAENVTCVWEGVAASKLTIEYQGETYTIVLNQGGGTETASTQFAGYEIVHRLDPYPRAGETIDPKDYRLTMSFAR